MSVLEPNADSADAERALGGVDPREPLRRVLAWIRRHEDPATHAIVCPVHRIEHTGKTANAVILAVELARGAAPEERADLVHFARRQCERIVSRLEREGDSTCFTFRPGRHDPYNCSNSVIDGGACSDALATVCLELSDELEGDERERFTRASVLHAQTYLRYAIVDKGIPAQCAWAMTGAAQAFRLSGHEVLRLACTVGAERIRGQMRADGSLPYHAEGAEHPGAADASAYYHSRVFAFTAFALDAVLGPEAGAAEDSGFAAGLDFLHGLAGPDGVKAGAVEAKPWYWGGPYEVASHPFDIAAFAHEWHRTRAPRARAALLASWRSWLEHLSEDGEVSSFRGRGRRSYQCPMFWASHACWAARALPALEEALAASATAPPAASTVGVQYFADTGLARIDTGAIVAWVRGPRPPGNASHGSPLGGLLRVHARATARDLFLAPRFERRPEGHWSGAAGSVSPVRGWRAGAKDLRFSGWLMRNAWRGGRRLGAAREPLRALRRSVLDYAASTVSTAFDRAAALEVTGTGAGAEVRIVCALAQRASDGARLGRVERTFRIGGDGALEVEDLCIDDRGVRGLWFRAPERAVVVEQGPRRALYRFL
ncbi:MAG: hypothetical protein AAFZ87_05205 [Planctomycetota bacterium]